jgi:hypothetical protein
MKSTEIPLPEGYKEISATRHWAGQLLASRNDFRFLKKPVGYQEPESSDVTLYAGVLTVPWWDNQPIDVPTWIKVTDSDSNGEQKMSFCMAISERSQYADIDRFHQEAENGWKSWVSDLVKENHDVNWQVFTDTTEIVMNSVRIEWGNSITDDTDPIPFLMFDLTQSDEIEEGEEATSWLSPERRDETVTAILSAIQRTWRSAYDFVSFFEKNQAPELYKQVEEIPDRPLTGPIHAFVNNALILQPTGAWETPRIGITSDMCRATGFMQLGNNRVETSLTQSFYDDKQTDQILALQIWYVYSIFLDWKSINEYVDQSMQGWKQTILYNTPLSGVPVQWKYEIGRAEDTYKIQNGSAGNQWMIGFSYLLDTTNLQTLHASGLTDTNIIDTLLGSIRDTFPKAVQL